MILFLILNRHLKALLWGAFVILVGCTSAPDSQLVSQLDSSQEPPPPKSLKSSKVHYQMGQSLELQGEFYEAQKQYHYALRYLEEFPIDSIKNDSSLNSHFDLILSGLESSWSQAEGEFLEDTLSLWLNEVEAQPLDEEEQFKIKGLSDKISYSEFSIPIVLNDRVYEQLHYLSQKVPKFMSRSLTRKSLYDELIYRELDSMNVPRDLIYQALVESGYKTSATSTASAGGIWQFIPSTGRAYGMKIDWWVDERRDPLKSTRAAIQYMKRLYQRFGDWYLAMAAYNAGGGRINRAIRKAGSRNYWDLKLPRETMHYVPRIIAATIIGHFPEKYNIKVSRLKPRVYSETTVSHCIPFSTISKLIEVPEDSLKALNPELSRWCTPSDVSKYNLKLPPNKVKLWEEQYAKLDKSKLKRLHRHTVRSGEFLGKIAKQYNISVKDIMLANKMRSTRLRVGQLLIIPLPSELGARYQRSKVSSGKTSLYKVKKGDNLYTISKKLGVGMQTLLKLNRISPKSSLSIGQILKYPSKGQISKPQRNWSSKELTTYKVQSGDSYYTIGLKFGVTAKELMAINRTGSSSLKVGQRLKVPKSSSASQSSSKGQSSSKNQSKPSQSKVYKVVRGDNLFNIAQRFGMKLEDLVQLNKLQKGESIYPGMKLKVGASSGSGNSAKTKTIAGVKWYVVQSGDTLWGISKRYNVSVENLKKWNQLDRRPLLPGMNIKIGNAP